jgi:hypothetical protein
MHLTSYSKIIIILSIILFYLLMRLMMFEHYCYPCNFTSSDFLWVPAKMLTKNVDFYQLVINNLYETDPLFEGGKKYVNVPVYTILHYYIIYPLGLASFTVAKEIWLIINCIILAHTFLLISANAKVGKKNSILILFIFLFSKPLIYSMAIGQFSIFCLYAFVCYFFIKSKVIKILTIIFAFTKLTFSPILGIYLLIKKEKLIISLLVATHLLAVILYSLQTGSDLVQNFFYQFTIPKKYQTSGAIDFMTIIGNNPAPPFNFILTIIISTFFYILYYKNTKRDKLSDLCAVCLITIIFIRHLYYDMIFLLPMLFFIFKEKKINKTCLIIIIYFFYFYFNSFTYGSIRYNKFFMIINFFIIFFNIYYLYEKNKIKNNLLDRIYEKIF